MVGSHRPRVDPVAAFGWFVILLAYVAVILGILKMAHII